VKPGTGRHDHQAVAPPTRQHSNRTGRPDRGTR
jgi:hypothetical protein